MIIKKCIPMGALCGAMIMSASPASAGAIPTTAEIESYGMYNSVAEQSTFKNQVGKGYMGGRLKIYGKLGNNNLVAEGKYFSAGKKDKLLGFTEQNRYFNEMPVGNSILVNNLYIKSYWDNSSVAAGIINLREVLNQDGFGLSSKFLAGPIYYDESLGLPWSPMAIVSDYNTNNVTIRTWMSKTHGAKDTARTNPGKKVTILDSATFKGTEKDFSNYRGGAEAISASGQWVAGAWMSKGVTKDWNLAVKSRNDMGFYLTKYGSLSDNLIYVIKGGWHQKKNWNPVQATASVMTQWSVVRGTTLRAGFGWQTKSNSMIMANGSNQMVEELGMDFMMGKNLKLTVGGQAWQGAKFSKKIATVPFSGNHYNAYGMISFKM